MEYGLESFGSSFGNAEELNAVAYKAVDLLGTASPHYPRLYIHSIVEAYPDKKEATK